MTFDEFLSAYPAEVQRIASAARRLVQEVFPQAVEMVDAPSKLVAYSRGPRYADMVCTLQPYKGHVNLGIYRAVELLPHLDPQAARRIEGTGKMHRHVKLEDVSEVETSEVRSILEAAVARIERTGLLKGPPA